MPDAPETIALVKDGHAITVPIDRAGWLIHEGYRVETPAMQRQREDVELAEERKPSLGASIAMGAVRGATLGLSDVAARAFGTEDTTRELRELESAHPVGSLVGQIGGAIATGGLGSSRLGAAVAERSPGLAGKIVGGALEGVPQNVGAYVSDVALGNKPLSGDAFVGAMGEGALWGAGAAASFGGLERGLGRARRMFAASEMTPETAARAEQEAMAAIGSLRDEGASLHEATTNRLREIRQDISSDPARAAELQAIAHGRAAEVEAAVSLPAALEKATGTAAQASTSQAPDDLLGQLTATKARLDQGEQFKGMGRPHAIEDAVNDHVAREHPEAARLVTAQRELRDADTAMDSWLGSREDFGPGVTAGRARGAPAVEHAAPAGPLTPKETPREWAARIRPKQAGYYSSVPEGEGNVALPRGREYEFRGSDLDRSIAELDTMSKFERGRTLAEKITEPRVGETPLRVRGEGYEPTIKGKSAAERVEGAPGRPVTAQDVIDTSNAQRADRGLPPIDEQLKAAVRAKVNKGFANEDVNDAINALSRYERAHAEAADALGGKAPPLAADRAKQYRSAEAAHAERTTGASAGAIADADKASHTLLGRLQEGAGKLGEATELLHMLGVQVPDPRDIPLIGPVLSLYLKARIGARVMRGMTTGKNVESAIASKAAAMRNRVATAIDKALAGAERGTRAVGKAAPAAAALLGHELFRARDSKPQPTGADLESVFAARSAEIADARRPGAIADAVRAQVHASDPAIVAAITDTQTRKLQFLDAKMPKPSAPGGLFDLETAWTPDRQSLNEWARYVEAAENPGLIVERISKGELPSHEALETVRTVYPELWAEAQKRVIDWLSTGGREWPYATRVYMGVVFRLPLDGSAMPGFGAFAQQGYRSPPPAPTPSPAPTLRTDVKIGQATSPRVDGRPAT